MDAVKFGLAQVMSAKAAAHKTAPTVMPKLKPNDNANALVIALPR